MAEFKFPCPQCGQNIQCDVDYAGVQINCPTCQKPIIVPAATPAPSAAPSRAIRQGTPTLATERSPVPDKSRVWRNVLIIAATMIILAGLVIGGWYGYAKFKVYESPKEGLIAYYPLNGNAVDASGNKHDGQIVGVTPGNGRFGKADSALSFNGVDNYISFETVPLKKLDEWSLCAWIKPASINQNSMAICLGSDDGRLGNGFELGISGGDRLGSHLYGILGGVAWIDSGYVFPSPNVWYHIVMLRTGGTTKFYVNGIQTAKTESRKPLVPKAFTIGSATGIRFFNGMIANVRLYNRALSDSEIKALAR